MDNQDVSKLKAKSRVELLILFFVLVLAVGGVAEYRHLTAPMSSAMVVFDYADDKNLEKTDNTQKKISSSQAQKNAITVPAEAQAPTSELNPPKALEISAPSVAENEAAQLDDVKNLSERVQPQNSEQVAQKIQDNNKQIAEKGIIQDETIVQRDGAAELTNYMQDIHQKAESITRPQSALGQIQERQEVKKTQRQPQPVFEAGKIEIYDSEKGVVAVQETVEVIAPEKTVQEEKMVDKETAELSEVQTVDNVKKPETAKASNAQSAEVVKTETNSVEQKVVAQTKELANVDVNKTVTADVSDKAQPTLLVPVKNEPVANNEVAPKPAETKSEIKQDSAKEAPVDMIKAMQESKAPVKENTVKSTTAQENIINQNDEISSNIVSEKPITSVTKTVEEKQNEVKEQIVDDKEAKSKKANEALENLFKKMSEPNALTNSTSGEKVGEVTVPVVGAIKSESVENKSSISQGVENNAKNNAETISKVDESGAVDMMKAIVSRQ